MRVLFAIAHLDKGGGQALQSLALYRRMRREVDAQMLCLSAYGRPGDSSAEEGVEIVGRLRYPAGVAELSAAIRARLPSVDLVQVLDFYYALPAARFARAHPIVVRVGSHPSGDLGDRYGAPAAAAMRLVNPWLYSGTRVIVNGRHLLSAFPTGRAVWIPNGVDVDRFASPPNSGAARAALDLPLGVPLLVYTGKVTHRKRLEDVFWLLRELPRAHLLLVGQLSEPLYGPDYYRSLCAAFPDVVARVHAVGEVSSDRIPRLLEAGDVFVFPSGAEGMPNSVLEAMSAGLPVVATDIPPHRDILPAGTGYLYRSREQLRSVVSELLDDPRLRRTVGDRARALVSERFGFSATVAGYLAVYRETLARN